MLQLRQLKNSQLFVILLLFLLLLPSIAPLLHKGFFQSDDGEWMVIRFSAFYQALRDGQFPVRFLTRLNHGFGYPVADFLYPGFMYLGVPLHVLGFGFVNTIKILFGASLVASGIFFYLWVSRLFSKIPSFFSSLMYVYLPYHIYDLYKRGSLGEMLALSIAPFVLFQIERRSVLWTSLGVGFLLLSHNTLALLFLPFIVIYGMLRYKTLKNIFVFFLMISMGLGISAFYWIPALYDLQFTIFSSITVADWITYFSDWNLYGISTILPFILAIVVVATQIQNKKTKTKNILILPIFFIIVGLLSFFFSIKLSKNAWQFIPSQTIQFPFRFLSVVILCASFLTAFFISSCNKKMQIIFGSGFFIIIFFSSVFFLQHIRFTDKGEGFYTTNEDSTTVKNEYMPKWVKIIPTHTPESLVTSLESLILVKDIKTNRIIFETNGKENSLIDIQRIYFPGWHAFINTAKTPLLYMNDHGIMQVRVPSGIQTVTIQFNETPLRIIADSISLFSFLGILLLSFKKKSGAC